jgi:MYXO-CTERM domain-containing protein
MTVDPVFVFNGDLPDVSNIHQANRVIECDAGVYEFEAPWRIDFPQGSVIRGTPDTVGQWPDAVNDQPPNLRVLTLAASGEGAVLADNGELINDLLATYNAGVPGPDGEPVGVAGPSTIRDGDSGFCSLGAGPRPTSPPVPLALGLGALFGAGLLRRRAGTRSR